MLKNFFDRWKAKTDARDGAQADALAVQSEVQQLRLELAEKEGLIQQLKADLERERSQGQQRSARQVQESMEALLAELAGPLSQLFTQDHLVSVENKPLQARDVLVVAKSLARGLQNRGLTLEGAVGEYTAFDPDHHQALSAEAQLAPGQLVVIRFSGLSYQGRLLRKAGVSPSQE